MLAALFLSCLVPWMPRAFLGIDFDGDCGDGLRETLAWAHRRMTLPT